MTNNYLELLDEDPSPGKPAGRIYASWNNSSQFADRTISYSFDTLPENYTDGQGGYAPYTQSIVNTSTITQLLTSQKTVVNDLLSSTTLDHYRASFSDVANIGFENTTGQSVGDIAIQRAEITYGPEDGLAFKPFYNDFDIFAGDIWIDTNTNNNLTNKGQIGYFTVLHELAHSIGLDDTINTNLSTSEDNQKYTVMSYNFLNGMTASQNSDYVAPASLQLYDIAAVQKLYGINWTTRNEDNTQYSKMTAFASTQPSDAFIYTIWDGGGEGDTIDASGYTVGATINLNEGAFSSIGLDTNGNAAVDNVAIAYNAAIENATGTAHNDSIIGNFLNNTIIGGDGNDTIDALTGNDTVDYASEGGANGITVTSTGYGQYSVTDTFSDTDTLNSVENIVFTSKDDVLELNGNHIAGGFDTITYDAGAEDNYDYAVLTNAVFDPNTDQLLNRSGNGSFELNDFEIFDGEAGTTILGDFSNGFNYTSDYSAYDYSAYSQDVHISFYAEDTIEEAGGIWNYDMENSVTAFDENIVGSSHFIGFFTQGGDGPTYADAINLLDPYYFQGGGSTVYGSHNGDTITAHDRMQYSSYIVPSGYVLSGRGDDTYNYYRNYINPENPGDDYRATNITYVYTGGDDYLYDGYTLGSIQIEGDFYIDQTIVSLSNGVLSLNFSTGNSLDIEIEDPNGNLLLPDLSFANGGDITLSGSQAIKNGTASNTVILSGTWDTDTWTAVAGKNQTYIAKGGNDILDAGDGNDYIDGGIGNDTIIGGIGDDQLVYNSGLDNFSDINGQDTVVFSGGINFKNASVTELSGSTKIVFEAGVHELTLYNHTLSNQSFEKVNIGTGGILTYEKFYSYLIQASVGEAIIGNDTDDTLLGTLSGDVLNGLNGNDYLYGDYGDDLIVASLGSDFVFGGQGNDTIIFKSNLADYNLSQSGSAITFTSNLETSSTTVEEIEQFVFNGIEYSLSDIQPTLTGTSSNDFLIGGLVNNTIYGLDGNDWISGELGDDTIFGGNGDDIIYLGQGSDTVTGGEGADVYIVTEVSGHSVIKDFDISEDILDLTNIAGVYSDQELEWAITSGGHTLFLDTPQGLGIQLEGTDFWDLSASNFRFGIEPSNAGTTTLPEIPTNIQNGTTSHDNLYAGWSTGEVLNGYEGNDSLYGGIGNDYLYGGADDDALFGGDGNDVLVSGDGMYDYMVGGEGDDFYLFTGSNSFGFSSIYEEGGLDTIIIPNEVTISDLAFDIYGDTLSISSYSSTYNWSGVEISDQFASSTSNVEFIIVSDVSYYLDDIAINGVWNVYDPSLAPNENDLPKEFDDDFEVTNTQETVGNVLYDNGYGADYDPNNINISVEAIVFSGAFGNFNLSNDGSFSFIPDISFTGIQSFDYTLQDLDGNEKQATITFNVLESNTAPLAVEDNASTDVAQTVTINVLANDTDPENDTLSVINVQALSGANVQINPDNTISYTPVAGFFGQDSFEYTIEDTGGLQSTATVYIDVNANVIDGTNSSENINGTASIDVISGFDGADIIYGYEGNDYLIGGAGDDLIRGHEGDDVINLGAVTLATIFNLDNSETFIQNAYGGDGDDIIYGSGEKDFLYGDGGNDIIYGGNGANRMYGGDGDDTVYGGDGLDTAYLGAGNDYFDGGIENDHAYGEAGDDTLIGGTYQDFLYGGADNDTIYGGENADYLYGDEGLDVIYGDDHNDRIEGGDGADTLHGGAGADTIFGDFDDTNVLGGNDTIYGDNGNDTVQAGAGDDLIYGGNQNDALYGNQGNDTVYGGNHDDLLDGQDGNDFLNGESGIDTIYGGDGADILIGGSGQDFLYAGDDASVDVFGFSASEDSEDRIYNFELLEDQINITDLLTGYTDGVSDISDFVEIVHTGSRFDIRVDSDGGADNFISVARVLTDIDNSLTAEDLLNNGTLIANSTLV